MKQLGFFIARNLSIVLICSYFKNVEWTKDHDIQLAKEILVSDPTASSQELCKLDYQPLLG